MASKKRADSELVIAVDDKTSAGFKKVQHNMRNMASGAAAMEGPLGGVAGRLNSIGAALGRMGPLQLGFIGSLAASSTILYKALGAGSEYERQMFRIQKQLEITGMTAGVTSEEIESMARRLGEATLAGAGEARNAASSLLVYKNITGEMYEEVLKLGQDLTAVMGGSLESNVKKIARAFDNPRQGLESLSRTVLSLDDEMRKNIQTMFDSGDVAGAQGAIFDKLRDKIGGAGQGEAAGLAGAVDTLGERWTHMLELISSSGAGNVGTGFTNLLSNLVDKINHAMRTDSQNELLETQRRQAMQIKEQYSEIERVKRNGYYSDEQRNEIIKSTIVNIGKLTKEHQAELDVLIPGRIAAREIAKATNENKKAQAKIDADIVKYGKEQVALAIILNDQAKERQKIFEVNKRAGEAIYQASLSQEEKISDLYVRRLIDIENLSMEEIGGKEKKDKILLGLHRNYLKDIGNLEEKTAKPDNREAERRKAILNSIKYDLNPQDGLDAKYEADKKILDQEVTDIGERNTLKLQLQQQYHTDSQQISRESAEKQKQWLISEWAGAEAGSRTEEWVNSWIEAGSMVSQGIGNAVADSILEQKNLAEAGIVLAKQVAHQIISSLVRIGIENAVQHSIAMGLKAKATAATVASNAAIAASAAPAAAGVSLATAGTNSIPAGAGVSSTYALAAGLALAGQAHDGLPFVPKTGTYLLEKGERVVKQQDNKELSMALKNDRGGLTVVQNFSFDTIDGASTAKFVKENQELFEMVGVSGVQKAYNQRGNRGPLG